MRVSLALDEYLSEFPIFNMAKDLLDTYYDRYGESEDPLEYNIKVKEQYPALYDVVNSIRLEMLGITWEEIWFIANAVYSKKGVVESMLMFCKYIDINSDLIAYNKEGQMITDDTDDKVPDHYIIEIKDVTTNSVNVFLTAINALLSDLLIWSNYAIRIDRLLVEYKTSFKIDVVWNIRLRHEELITPEVVS